METSRACKVGSGDGNVGSMRFDWIELVIVGSAS